jgi:hypothetical protein
MARVKKMLIMGVEKARTVRAVAQAIPQYIITTFKVPKKVCDGKTLKIKKDICP